MLNEARSGASNEGDRECGRETDRRSRMCEGRGDEIKEKGSEKELS